jgi:hypothetical protein
MRVKLCVTYLSCFEAYVQLIVHQRLESTVILVRILVLAFLPYFFNRVLLRQLALDGNVTRVNNKMLAVLGRDTVAKVQLDMLQKLSS